MKIIRAIGELSDDYAAIYECEFCKFRAKWSAENNDKFYRLVVPNKKCPRCGKKRGGYLPYASKIKTWWYHGKS